MDDDRHDDALPAAGGDSPPSRQFAEPGMSGRESIDRIKAELADRIGALASELLPLGGHAHGRQEWQEAKQAKGGLGDSLTVRLTGPKAGQWGHFAAGRSGDALGLIAYLRTGGDRSEAVKWALGWLGWKTGVPPQARAVREAGGGARARETGQARDEDARRRAAHALFLGAARQLRNTPVEAYLAGRGLALEVLARHSGGRQPGALRYAAQLKYPGGKGGPALYPAMLAGIHRPPLSPGEPGRFQAVHRTWLAERDGGTVKAPVRNPKKSLGTLRGGACLLWRGLRVDPATGEASYGRRIADLARAGPVHPDERTLVIAEGIEDALTIAHEEPRYRVWAGISLSAMRHLAIPPPLDRVIFYVDNDPELLDTKHGPRRHPAREARDAAIAAWQRQGKEVLIANAGSAKDANELHRRLRGP